MASTLICHENKQNSNTNANNTVEAIEVTVLLDLIYKFRQTNPEYEFLLKLITTIGADILRVVYNVFGWNEYEQKDSQDWHIKSHVANCQCLIGSLMNHSCVPNVNWEWKNGEIWFTTNRTIGVGQHLTITYGPHKNMDYFKRQLVSVNILFSRTFYRNFLILQHLNHYLFACACSACYVDAIKGDCLQCRNCSGPVVFNSAANNEPNLNGYCLSCCQPYAQFNRSIRALKSVKDRIQTLAALVKIKADEPNLLTQAVYLLKRLLNLSLGSSEPIIETVFVCSSVIEHFPQDELNYRSKRDLINLALIINTALPMDIPSHLLKGSFICSIRFWLYSLQRWIKHMFENENDLKMMIKNYTDSNEYMIEMRDALRMFNYRYQEALHFLISNNATSDGPLHQMVRFEIQSLNKQLQNGL